MAKAGKETEMTESRANIGKRIQMFLERKEITQRELAGMANMTETTMSRIISGDRQPKINQIQDIANALEISIDTLLGNDEDNFFSDEQLKALRKPAQKLHDMGDALEQIKVVSALKSEAFKMEFRQKKDPKSISILDYTIIAALFKRIPNIPTQNEGEEFTRCPDCGEKLKRKAQNFCSECGQALARSRAD